jgi:hypothetical protein
MQNGKEAKPNYGNGKIANIFAGKSNVESSDPVHRPPRASLFVTTRLGKYRTIA